MKQNRINLHDDLITSVMKMAEGNPGAVTALSLILKEDGIFPVLHLDQMGIYGSRIWMLYKDVCDQSVEKLLILLRASILHLVPEVALQHAIDYGDKIDHDLILALLKEELRP